MDTSILHYELKAMDVLILKYELEAMDISNLQWTFLWYLQFGFMLSCHFEDPISLKYWWVW